MNSELIEVTIEKLVEGGQGLGILPDGKKIFVWNALPGETLGVRLIKRRSSYAEGIAETVIKASAERIVPLEANYLATSPWQMMTFAAENAYKQQIAEDIFTQAKVALPTFKLVAAQYEQDMFHYRNKMEYSFWGDDDGIHLALHHRGSHGKQIVTSSAIAMPQIDAAGNALCQQLTALGARAGDLKTLIIRATRSGGVAASLFVKQEVFPKLTLPAELQGLRVYFSNPKSPASVRTKLLQEMGEVLLHDTLLGQPFIYDADSFFQINVPIYEQALAQIKAESSEPVVVDMYAGVGSIGLSVATEAVELIELDMATAAMATQNAETSRLNATVIQTSAEQALEYITNDKPVIFDPPRAGLHQKVVDRVLEVRPARVTYLSCNPVTQARDLSLLQDSYEIVYFEAFNFFPRTPHIETLAILRRR